MDVKVLSIVGYTRSGSTLLDTVLGSIDGFFSSGELHYLWERGLIEGRLCGCGQPVGACDVWSRALREGFGDLTPDARRVAELQHRCARTRHTLRLLRVHRGRSSGWSQLDAYAQVVGDLYRGIASATAARVIVDSSKRPSDAAVTRILPSVDPYVVHLVRDPRAVVHSWRRRKRELDKAGEDMPQQPVLQSISGWIELNSFSGSVRRRFGRRAMLLRYEDLMADPRGSVQRIVDLVGEGGTELPFVSTSVATVRRNHTVGGNPNRFHSGELRLRIDEEWKRTMPDAPRRLTTALTMPWLLRYGYPLRSGPAPS